MDPIRCEVRGNHTHIIEGEPHGTVTLGRFLQPGAQIARGRYIVRNSTCCQTTVMWKMVTYPALGILSLTSIWNVGNR